MKNIYIYGCVYMDVGLTYDPVSRPDVANLLTILAAVTGQTPEQACADIISRDPSGSKATLKHVLTEALVETLTPIRTEFGALRNDRAYLSQVYQQGGEKARGVASVTLDNVKQTMGLK